MPAKSAVLTLHDIDLSGQVDFLVGCCQILTTHLTLRVTAYNFPQENVYRWPGLSSVGAPSYPLAGGSGLCSLGWCSVPRLVQRRLKGRVVPGSSDGVTVVRPAPAHAQRTLPVCGCIVNIYSLTEPGLRPAHMNLSVTYHLGGNMFTSMVFRKVKFTYEIWL